MSPWTRPTHRMATLTEFEQAAVEGSDTTSPAVEDTGWDQSFLLPDRNHVNALLDISEANFLKEQEPYEYHCLSGWEEAVRGWGRVTPLACMFLPQRKGKKPKNREPDHHCLLCVDLRLPNLDSSANSPEYHCEPHADPHDRGFKKTMPLTLRMHSHTAVSAPVMEAPEWPVLTAMQSASQHLLLREKMVDEGKLRESQQLSSPLQPHHLTTPKCPVLKNKPTKHHKQTHRPTNIILSINSFTVLPPVELPQLNPQVSGQLCNGESTAKGETSEVDSVMSARENRGVEGGEETREESVLNPELPKDTYCATLTSKYCTCQHSHHLLSAFSVSFPKRYEVPLTSKADTVHRPSYSLGKNLLQALRHSSGYSRYTRPATPQLPILLGTKVPMPVSGQRLL